MPVFIASLIRSFLGIECDVQDIKPLDLCWFKQFCEVATDDFFLSEIVYVAIDSNTVNCPGFVWGRKRSRRLQSLCIFCRYFSPGGLLLCKDTVTFS
jgi:hypothetical protein